MIKKLQTKDPQKTCCTHYIDLMNHNRWKMENSHVHPIGTRIFQRCYKPKHKLGCKMIGGEEQRINYQAGLFN